MVPVINVMLEKGLEIPDVLGGMFSVKDARLTTFDNYFLLMLSPERVYPTPTA